MIFNQSKPPDAIKRYAGIDIPRFDGSGNTGGYFFRLAITGWSGK